MIKSMTLTITHIPDSEPAQLLADLIEVTSHVDAPLDMAAVKRAAEAWIVVSTMATELGNLDNVTPRIALPSLIAMFSGVATGITTSD